MEELHPFVAGLLDLWRSKRPPGGVPHRAEFDVFTLRPWLGWLTVYEELDGGTDFLVRLDGSNIVALTGDEWTGHRMSELNPRYALRCWKRCAGRCGNGSPSWISTTSRP